MVFFVTKTWLGLGSTSLVWVVNMDQTDCSPNGPWGGGEGVLGGWLDSGSDRLAFGGGVMRVSTSVVAPSVMSAGSPNMFGCALVVFSFGMLDVFADMCFQF